MITNYDLRQRSGKMIRPNMQTLLVMALVVALPGLITNVIIARTGSDLTSYLFSSGIDTSSTVEEILDAIGQYRTERWWFTMALQLLSLLITPALSMGLYRGMLTLLRGGTTVVGDVFSLLRVIPRAALLSLWIAIKMILWALPGALLIGVAFVADGALFLLLMLAGIGLIVAGVIMAEYRFAMSFVYLADEPETGILECARRSKAVMKNRKMQLFMLTLSYNLGRMVAISLGVELLGYVVGNLVSMVVQLIMAIYINGAYCAFYEAYARPEGGRAHAFQTDPYHDEMQE